MRVPIVPLMDEERLSAELRLALLSAIAQKRRAFMYNTVTSILTKLLTRDEDIIRKVYAIEIQPILVELIARGVCTEHYDWHRDGWYLAVTDRGKQIAANNTCRSLEEAILLLEQKRGYALQTHFLPLLDKAVARPSETESSSPPKPKRAAVAQKRPSSPTIAELIGEDFDPKLVVDERERVAALVVRRRGQDRFRALLLSLYGGRCAITGCNAVDALEAAHIIAYKGKRTNHVANGLILRSDLHALFDLGLITIDEVDMSVLIAPSLQDTAYQDLQGRRLTLPDGDYRISVEALKTHREWAEKRWAQANS